MKITALVGRHDYDIWRESGAERPNSFCAGAFGPGVVIVEEVDYSASHGMEVSHVRCTFEVPDDQLSEKMKHRLAFHQGVPT